MGQHLRRAGDKSRTTRFTMIEMLIVVTILLILSALLVGALVQSRQTAKYQRWVLFKQDIRADDDLMAYYTFETGEGKVLTNEALGAAGNRDYRPQQYDGAIEGAQWRLNAGRWSGKWALYFNGINDHVDLGLSFGKAEVSALTVLAWVKPEGTDREVVVSADGNDNWELALGSATAERKPEWTTTDSSGVTHKQVSDVKLNKGWRLVVGWYNSKGLLVDKRILIDGETTASTREHYGKALGDAGSRTKTFVTIGAASRAAKQGGDVDLSDCFKGYIDEVLIYSRALTDQEIKDHWRMGTQ